VIIGLGYVACRWPMKSRSGSAERHRLDVQAMATVNSLLAGRSHVDDLNRADVRAMLDGGFRAVDQSSRMPSAVPWQQGRGRDRESACRPRCLSLTART